MEPGFSHILIQKIKRLSFHPLLTGDDRVCKRIKDKYYRYNRRTAAAGNGADGPGGDHEGAAGPCAI